MVVRQPQPRASFEVRLVCDHHSTTHRSHFIRDQRSGKRRGEIVETRQTKSECEEYLGEEYLGKSLHHHYQRKGSRLPTAWLLYQNFVSSRNTPLAELYQATIIGADRLNATSPPGLTNYHPPTQKVRPFIFGHARRLHYVLVVRFRQSAKNSTLMQPIEASGAHLQRKAARKAPQTCVHAVAGSSPRRETCSASTTNDWVRHLNYIEPPTRTRIGLMRSEAAAHALEACNDASSMAD